MLLIDSSGLPQFRQQLEAKANRLDQDKTEAPVFFSLMRKRWFRAIARYTDPYCLTKQDEACAYNHSPVITEELIQRCYELVLRSGSRNAILSRFSAYNSTEEAVDIIQFNVPALIMWGQNNSSISIDVAMLFDAALSRSTLMVYNKIGHILMKKIPSRSAEDASQFLFEIYGTN
jgi:pimeloyl-ACP methyl ester carboxylesterase